MTYSLHSAYRQVSATSWTRIEMLLALYDASLSAVEQGHQAMRQRDEESLIKHRFRAQRLITELIAGVDTEQGEVPQNVHRLLTFCLMQICGRAEAEWASAAATLKSLQEAFRAIRDQAVELEQAGRIPQLAMSVPDQTLAVG